MTPLPAEPVDDEALADLFERLDLDDFEAIVPGPGAPGGSTIQRLRDALGGPVPIPLYRCLEAAADRDGIPVAELLRRLLRTTS